MIILESILAVLCTVLTVAGIASLIGTVIHLIIQLITRGTK